MQNKLMPFGTFLDHYLRNEISVASNILLMTLQSA
jgi:hypothetical protein